ncbi:transglutaminase domain-containing protein [Streptomyces thermoalcalitolerans]|uniref:Transglutaminase-like domain-containing protein n=1 Tax=Streptomyces thermoalcalitolerans TaxID=65605 RepID=A0ABN1NKX5_9ACTN
MVTSVSSEPRRRQLPEPERVEELVRRLRQVPDRQRRFSVTPAQARRVHGIRPELLAALTAAGVPHVGAGDERLYDAYDLGNAALHLGRLSVQRRSMRAWAKAWRTALDQAPGHRVQVISSCPAPGHPGPCRYGVLLGGRRRQVVGPAAEARLGDLQVAPALRDWPRFPPALKELLQEVADIGFFLLPEAVRWDLEFMWRTRMSDCGGAAAWLVHEGGRRGLESRFSFGLLVAPPYSTPHCWAEFRVDGVWMPVDPLLVRALNQWGGLDPDAFPPDETPGALFHRLTDRFTKVVSHGGIWAQVSLPTERAG